MICEVSEEERQREKGIRKVTLMGSLGNLVLLLFKFFAGIMGNSAAMMADAVHSLSDFATDLVVLLFVRLAGKPQDADHSSGHGKYETLATALIGMMLLGVGAMIFWNGAELAYGVCMGEHLPQPGYIALVAAIASVVVKELLYQYTAHASRKFRSKVMLANAWHHRSDALSSLGTMLGIGGAVLLGPSWRVLDPLAAILVSLLIIRMALKLMVPCVDELLEKSLPPEDEQFICDVIRSCEGAYDPHNLRTRRIGKYCAIEVHFRMDGNTTVEKAHAVTRTIERQLYERFGYDALINTHVEPLK